MRYPYLWGLCVLFAIGAIILFSQPQSRWLISGRDDIESVGKMNQCWEFHKRTGEIPLWNPYIFSGTPLYYRGPYQPDPIVIFLFWAFIGVFTWVTYKFDKTWPWVIYFIFLFVKACQFFYLGYLFLTDDSFFYYVAF